MQAPTHSHSPTRRRALAHSQACTHALSPSPTRRRARTQSLAHWQARTHALTLAHSQARTHALTLAHVQAEMHKLSQEVAEKYFLPVAEELEDVCKVIKLKGGLGLRLRV